MNEPQPNSQPKINLADFFQRFSTQVLWHFTGYNKLPDEAYRILNLILDSKTLKVGPTTGKIIMPNGKDRWGFRHSCMCDIPFRDLRIHMLRYGQFGIAFYKRPAITHGNYNPVLYVHRDNIIFQRMDGLLASIEAEVRSNPELAKRLQTFLLTVGGYVKRSDLIGKIEIDSRLDDSQDNNFYYEREWRSFHDWTFDDSAIAAIMIPQEFRNQFHELWKERFVNSSLISSQMVEAL